MSPIDLADIDPLKWAEVRRRAAAVTGYLALDNPGAADRERFAAMLDLGAHQFANLVKAWLEHKDAVALAPGMRRARLSKSRRAGIDPRSREIARAVIAELGTSASLDGMLAEVVRRCAADGVPPPSRSSLWLLAAEARGRDGSADPHSILVVRAHLRLPVDLGRGATFPEIVVAAEAPTGRIVDIVMVRPTGDFDARRIVEAIRHQNPSGTLPVVASEEEAKAIARYLPTDATLKDMPVGDATRELSNAVGKRIGMLEIAFRPPSVRPATVMRSGLDRPPGADDADLVLLLARERHNAGLALAA
jgi:hypothetical protein